MSWQPDGSPPRGSGTRRAVRIANCSGYYGDRLSAAREVVEGGPVDVVTGDYLAELTLYILGKSRSGRPDQGYARTFLLQLEEILATLMERGIRLVTNAGGLAPKALAVRTRELAQRLGLDPKIAHIEGDDLLSRLDELQRRGHEFAHLADGRPWASCGAKALTANAYLGAWGIVDALVRDADIVICPRVSDASLVVGPAAWFHGWEPDDLDALAGALVAGHVIECGPQTTGGNYSFFTELDQPFDPGYPIVEVEEDGSFSVTKHPGTGGAVTVGTVTEQLLYEIAGPRYLNPDVVARFDTIELAPVGPQRVRVTGVRGEAPPPTLKVGMNYIGGFKNTVTCVLTGLNVPEKAALAAEGVLRQIPNESVQVETSLVRSDHPDPYGNETATAELQITVRSPDRDAVGKRFSRAIAELYLSSYPGFFLKSPPGEAAEYAVFWPTTLPADEVHEVVVMDDGERVEVPQHAATAGDILEETDPDPSPAQSFDGPTAQVPLGLVFGARSGDKAGDANLGIWARGPLAYGWLAGHLSVERLKQLIPEAAGLPVDRYELPNLNALNFVVRGLLGQGVAASTREDPQAKGLGEFLRSRVVDLPILLVEEARRAQAEDRRQMGWPEPEAKSESPTDTPTGEGRS